MLCRKQPSRIILLPLLITIILGISACIPSKGSIVILEDPNGTGCKMDFKEWSLENKYELSLNKGDVLQIEVDREEGKIALMISGQNGSEPYSGNNLKSGMFTVTVSETDQYAIKIKGKNATGNVTVTVLE
ncbi:hypothetical protein [Defluviitalea saccharophila]|uniref:GOLD domain-containing protein n=1 Tax=Defluviitalea saccharophila TaxID=879970 RepID=A0ABZ2Y330_9FIRM